MKKVMFEGKEYEVEDWVNFVSKDADGAKWKYENKPETCVSNWGTRGKGRYNEIRVDGVDGYDWKDSLIEV